MQGGVETCSKGLGMKDQASGEHSAWRYSGVPGPEEITVLQGDEPQVEY